MKIKVSIGEVVDKYTILKIKSTQISDKEKLVNVLKELDYVESLVFEVEGLVEDDLFFALSEVNKKLWKIEDDIRDLERKQDFKDEFIQLARFVYFTNDERAEIKKKINVKYGSEFVEEKSYQKY